MRTNINLPLPSTLREPTVIAIGRPAALVVGNLDEASGADVGIVLGHRPTAVRSVPSTGRADRDDVVVPLVGKEDPGAFEARESIRVLRPTIRVAVLWNFPCGVPGVVARELDDSDREDAGSAQVIGVAGTAPNCCPCRHPPERFLTSVLTRRNVAPRSSSSDGDLRPNRVGNA